MMPVRVCRFMSTKIRPSAPLYLHKLGDKIQLSLVNDAKAAAIGEFPQAQEQALAAGLGAEQDTYEPKPVLPSVTGFRENPQFWKIAREVLKQHIHTCPVFSMMALAESKAQFFHIYDLRHPPAPGRIPEVEDILGTVQLDNGHIIPRSFEPNSMYRPVTTYGAPLLSSEMADKVAEALS